MASETAPGRGVEQSVYLVGGLGLGLFGIQSLATTVVNIYGGMYNPNRALDISPPTWAGWVAGLVVGVLFLASGAYLLFRARRLGWRGSAPVAGTVASPQ